MYTSHAGPGRFSFQYRICESHAVSVSPHLLFDTEVMATGTAFPIATTGRTRIRTMVTWNARSFCTS
jgi:hypothetical protein